MGHTVFRVVVDPRGQFSGVRVNKAVKCNFEQFNRQVSVYKYIKEIIYVYCDFC